MSENRCRFCLDVITDSEILCQPCISCSKNRERDDETPVTPSLTGNTSVLKFFASYGFKLKHFTEVIQIVTSNSQIYTNVPNIILHHSPGGFNIGYPGSGPADLALNLAQLALNEMDYEGPITKIWGDSRGINRDCSLLAWRIHQHLKEAFTMQLEPDENHIVNWRYFIDNTFMPLYEQYKEEMTRQFRSVYGGDPEDFAGKDVLII